MTKTAAERYDEAIGRAEDRCRENMKLPNSGARRPTMYREECIAAIDAAVADGVAEALMRATERRSVELAAQTLENGVVEAAVAGERARCLAIARSHTYGLNIMDVSGTAERIAAAIEDGDEP